MSQLDGETQAGGTQEPEWLHGHPHEPNPAPPGEDAALCLILPDGSEQRIAPAQLADLPQTEVADCYIVNTGHGTSGPFVFEGVRLRDFCRAWIPTDVAWHAVDVISGDGFGNRVQAQELEREGPRAILLATHIDGEPMTRGAGLVRLIVPSETDDALRQVKWVAKIVVLS